MLPYNKAVEDTVRIGVSSENMMKIIGIAQKEQEVLLYYTYTKGQQTFFKVVTSANGYQFQSKPQYVIVTDEKKREEKEYNLQDIHATKQKESYLIRYKTITKGRTVFHAAISADLIRWTKQGSLTELQETAAVVPEYKYKNRYVAYVGEASLSLAFSGNFTTWKTGEVVLAPRVGFFDDGALVAGDVFQSNGNILLLYYVKKKVDNALRYFVGAALFDKKDPNRLLWRSDTPIWEHAKHFHNEELAPLGAALLHEELILYWSVDQKSIFAVSCQLPGKYFGLKDKEFQPLLKKTDKNPIISPVQHKPWESRATFNTAAVYEDGKVHFVYRALGDSDLSVLGYATSKDGITIDERSKEPIYVPREPFETPGGKRLQTFADHFVSGGGYGGVEDPRITKIDDRFYMTYVAFDGASPPRVALTSISVEDFLSKKWDKWEKPKLISAPGMVNKNAVIFPEKINGKYVVFHRIYPNVLIDFVDDLKFDKYLRGDYFIPPRRTHWDSKKVGAGAPPIKTKDGWLFIYQAVGYQDSGRYKIGAMLLDKNDPTKVLYRANKPLIAPDEHYENAGHKAGVVYPCGAVVKDDNLLVYYGGADTVVCAAEQNLNTFLDQLKYNQEPKLKRVRTPILN